MDCGVYWIVLFTPSSMKSSIGYNIFKFIGPLCSTVEILITNAVEFDKILLGRCIFFFFLLSFLCTL